MRLFRPLLVRDRKVRKLALHSSQIVNRVSNERINDMTDNHSFHQKSKQNKNVHRKKYVYEELKLQLVISQFFGVIHVLSQALTFRNNRVHRSATVNNLLKMEYEIIVECQRLTDDMNISENLTNNISFNIIASRYLSTFFRNHQNENQFWKQITMVQRYRWGKRNSTDNDCPSNGTQRMSVFVCTERVEMAYYYSYYPQQAYNSGEVNIIIQWRKFNNFLREEI